jgi:excisionase family DNA binding protein
MNVQAPVLSPTPQCISVPTAAAMLGIGRSSVYAAIQRGELASVRLGRRVLVPIHAVNALIGAPTK